MEPPPVPPRPRNPFGRERSPFPNGHNYDVPPLPPRLQKQGDRLETNVPLKPKPQHGPIFSNRGAGVQWNREAARAPPPSEKQVPLFNGHYSVDCLIPYRLLSQVPHSNSSRDEYNHMRYTAVTCDPVDFHDEQFTLRPNLFASPRSTEILIIVTMYNEDEILFARTLRGILANISDLASRQEGPWGKSCWKNVVVCIIGDGRARLNPRTRDLLTLLGVHQEGVAKSNIAGKPVNAHLYEYTSQMRVEIKNGRVKATPAGALPCQMIFCLKERNEKKINSHRWALQAFGRILDPKICVFLDAGTEPSRTSIYHLWKAFDQHPTCGGVSALTKVFIPHAQNLLTDSIVAAQNFEYRTWNALDRPFDSLLGLRFDMPAAMFAYRLSAIGNDKNGMGPMNDYFRPHFNVDDGLVFNSNMFLTEDRVLSFALVMKKLCHWDLRYEHAATASIDVPGKFSEYVLQRRRWLNGNLFSSIYAVSHVYQVFRTNHSPARKALLFIQCIYQFFVLAFTWLSIVRINFLSALLSVENIIAPLLLFTMSRQLTFCKGNFFLIFHVFTIALRETFGFKYVRIADLIYMATLFMSFVFALGHGARDTAFLSALVGTWSAIMMFFGATFITICFSTFRTVYSEATSGPTFAFVSIPLAFVYFSWLVLAVLSGSPGYMFSSVIQYVLLLPTRINVVHLYALCNIHDVVWGVKGDDRPMKLPSVNVGGYGKSRLDFSGDNPADALEDMYEAAVQRLKRKDNTVAHSWAGDNWDLGFRQLRTLIMASWALGNGLLVFLVMTYIGEPTDLRRAMKFVGFVLWAYATLTGIKSTGALYYFVTQTKWLVRGGKRGKKKKAG